MQFKQEAEAKGTLLPARHPASRLVSKIGMRIAGVAQTDNHGQPIKHMKVQPLVLMSLDRAGLRS